MSYSSNLELQSVSLPTLLRGPPEYTRNKPSGHDDSGVAKNGKLRKMESGLPAVPGSFLRVVDCGTVSKLRLLEPERVSCGGRVPFT